MRLTVDHIGDAAHSNSLSRFALIIQGGFGRQTTRLTFLIGYTFDKNRTKKQISSSGYTDFSAFGKCAGSYMMM